MYNQQGSNLTLRVNREKLISELEAKQKEITEGYDALLKEFHEKMDALRSSGVAWADYHVAIAEGLREGHFTYGENGRIQTVDKRHAALPDRPSSSGSGDRRRLEYAIQAAEHDKDNSLQPIGAALRLLRLSDEDSVEIDSANYNGLLSLTVRRRNGYDY